MRRSELFLPASRETRGAGADAAKLLQRAGLVRAFGSGLWGFTAACQRVRRAVIARIREGMDAIGGQAVHLPVLQYRERRGQSGSWGSFAGEMLTMENRDGQDMCLAPSHEEGMDPAGRPRLVLRGPPLLFYLVASKFRDDHARNGLVRCKEFTMKDAYSFHVEEASLAETYDAVRGAYEEILVDLGVEFASVEADNSVMGGSTSEEFVAPVESGSDRLVHCTADGCCFGVTDEHDGLTDHEAGDACPDCGDALSESDGIEVGHVFQLGTRYSETMGLTVDDEAGREREVVMGSYGLGIERLVQTLLQHATDGAETDGCRWPVTDWETVAPYRVAIVPVGYEGVVREAADDLHESLGADDVLLFDDETQSVGERFAESDLLGIPATVVDGDEFRETGLVDVESLDGETEQVEPAAVPCEVSRTIRAQRC